MQYYLVTLMLQQSFVSKEMTRCTSKETLGTGYLVTFC